MEYVDILSMVTDSDRNTTKDFMPLINDIPTDYFPDSSLLSDTAIIKGTRDGFFVAVSKEDNIIVLKLFSEGTGTQHSCTKKVQLEFVPNLKEKLTFLQSNKPTNNICNDLKYHQLCMVATVYTRKAVSKGRVPFRAQYTICYYLRKNNKNQFFLQSEIRNKQPQIYNNLQVNEFSIFNKIKTYFQKELNKTYVSNENIEFEEFDNIDELKDIYDFDDVDYDEDDIDELMDSNEYEDDDLQDTDLSF